MSDTDTMQLEATDTAAAGNAAPEANATADTQTSVTPEPNGEQGSQPAANAATPDTKQTDGSLTPPNSQNPPQQPQTPAQPDPWEKRYSDLKSYTDKQVNQWQQRMQSQQAQMAELAKWKQEQEARAKQAALKPWSKAHPEHAKFGAVLERAKVVENQLRRIPANLPPEQQEAMKQAILGALSPEEQQQIGDYRDSLQNFQREFFTDPHGTLLPMVEQLAEKKVQDALAKIEAQQSVQREFADPTMAPLVQKYGQDLQKALSDGVPYEYSMHMLKMHAELEALRGRVKDVDGQAAQAAEQRRLAKGEAAITRDPRTPAQDPYELAKSEAAKRGISTGDKRFMELLSKYTK